MGKKKKDKKNPKKSFKKSFKRVKKRIKNLNDTFKLKVIKECVKGFDDKKVCQNASFVIITKEIVKEIIRDLKEGNIESKHWGDKTMETLKTNYYPFIFLD